MMFFWVDANTKCAVIQSTAALGPTWSENASLLLAERSSATERDQIFAAGAELGQNPGVGKAEITFKRLGFKMSAGEEKTKQNNGAKHRFVCVGG